CRRPRLRRARGSRDRPRAVRTAFAGGTPPTTPRSRARMPAGSRPRASRQRRDHPAPRDGSASATERGCAWDAPGSAGRRTAPCPSNGGAPLDFLGDRADLRGGSGAHSGRVRLSSPVVGPTVRTCAALAIGAVLMAGCGDDDFKNEARAPIREALTGVIQDDAVTVSPSKLGAGPVEITISNQTDAAHSITLVGDSVVERAD